MEFKLSNHKRDCRGFTLVEMMVGVSIGCLLLAALATLYMFSMRSFASLANYSDLNEKTRYASDIISRDIRSCLGVSNATPNVLVLAEPSGGVTVQTTYTYDPNAGTLTKSILNGQTTVLLTGIDSLNFTLYPKPNLGDPYEKFVGGASPSTAKLIGFQWSCSRRLVGSLNNSQSLEAAIVEMRNL
jgi:prepilin-type N-terminal cleavage/methylation domain-containing protein